MPTLFAPAFFAALAAAAPADLPGECFAKLRSGVSSAVLAAELGVDVSPALPAPRGDDRVGLSRIVRVRCAPGRETQVVAALAARSDVEWAERNAAGPGILAPLPDDPFVGNQWHVQQASDVDMDLPEAWQLRGTFDADPIVVAVIDSGFPPSLALPDLANMLWTNPGEVSNGLDDDGNGFVDDLFGYDFVVGESNPDGGHPHGVWIPSILAGRTDNASAIAGVAPGIRMMHLRSFDDSGDFPAGGPYAGKLAAAAAILYAVDEGARLVNNSWIDGTGPTQVILDAVQYAADNGVLMVMAAGNSNLNFSWPAQIAAAFAVAGISPNGQKWSGSHYGTWVDVSAGSHLVPILDPSGTVFLADGTSAAAPMVTGVAALLLSEDDTLPLLDLRRLIQLGAVDLDPLNPAFAGQLGAGFVNAEASLRLLLPVTDLGHALAGTTSPRLHAYGGTTQGATLALSVNGGGANAPALFVLGAAPQPIPAFGGTLVPRVDVTLPFLLDAAGGVHLEFPLAATLPPGVPVAWLQVLTADPGAPQDVAMTNAVQIAGV